MKILLLLLTTAIVPLFSNAQNSLSGKITGESGQSIIGATIYVSDLKRGTVSDTSGFYELKDLPSGIFLVEYRFLGFESKIVKIEIKGAVSQNIQLTESHTELKDALITGMSAATERKINPVPSISIDQEKLKESVSSNIIDALSKTAGISQITTGAGISKPVIRGLGFNRVLVLQNSIRQEGQQWGAEHGIEIDEFSVNRIEIIKGPGSLAYGSDAMAGVINILSPEPATRGAQNIRYTTTLHSNNLLQGHSLFYEKNKNDFFWNLQGTRKIASNYTNPYDGKVFNSGFNEADLNGMIGISKKWGFVQASYSKFHQQLGVIEGERDSTGSFIYSVLQNDSTLQDFVFDNKSEPVYKIYIPSQKVDHDRISLTGKIFRKNAVFQLLLGYQQNKRREYEWHSENGIYTTYPSIHQLLTTYNYDFNYHDHFSDWETTLGINGYFQNGANKGHEFIIPEYNLNDIGIYAITQRTFKKLFINAGVRYNYRDVSSSSLYLFPDGTIATENDTAAEMKFDAQERQFSAFAYSGGLSYKIKENLVIKGNLSAGFRAPNLSELGSNGAHEGTFRYEAGNKNLLPETSLQADLSVYAETEHFSIDAAAFYNNISNFIFIRKVQNSIGTDSTIVIDNEVNLVYTYDQKDAFLYGGELTFDIHPHPFDWLHFENSVSMVFSELKNSEEEMKYLPFTPSPSIQSELRAEFHDLNHHVSKIYFNVGLNYQFQQDRIFSAFNTETATPDYTLINAGFGIDIKNKKEKKMFSFIIGGTNLANVAYQNHLSRLKYLSVNPTNGRRGVYNMGRNIMFKLILPISY